MTTSKKTRVVNHLENMPISLANHLTEIAAETGVDTCDYVSCEKNFVIDGRAIETWYDEDANSSASAWKAFSMGIGNSSGSSREEAIARLVVKF